MHNIPTDSSKKEVQFWRDPDLDFLEMRRSSYNANAFIKHAHDTYSVGLVLDGESGFFHNGVMTPIRPGDIAVIGPDEVHACNPDPGSGMRYVMYYLAPAWMQKLADDVAGELGPPPVFTESRVRDAELFAKLNDLFDTLLEPVSLLEKESTTYAAFAQLVARYSTRHGVPVQESHSKAVERVRKFLEEHVERNVSLEELSELCGLSPYHLLRVFKNAVGLPPHAHQTQLRVNLAKKLLAQGQPIADVALRVGFTDQSHLSKKFKQAVGATPRQYQKAKGFS